MSRQLDGLLEWLADNDPSRIPYWPGASYTGRVGFRTAQELLELGASPIHLGVDRAGGGEYLMPFDGRVEWRRVGGAAGSLLRIVAEDVQLELQVMHTAADPGVSGIDRRMLAGERLPVRPGALGLSAGVHTHTEVLLPLDADTLGWLVGRERATILDGRLDVGMLLDHCAKHGLPSEPTVVSAGEQIRTWAIAALWAHVAVRTVLPEYRTPGWTGPTILVDSHTLLRI